MDSYVIFDQKVINGFTPVLTYAACEWFLIFLMFVDALLSYLLVWFARYCKLQMPCFLCSKLLHPLHWRLLLCRNHRSEVSSFMSCHNHGNNLADCRGMCDDCLLSFTKMTGPNPDMNRLLLGKLGYDLLSKSHFAHPRSCSCCNKPWRTRHHTQRLIRLGPRGRNSPVRPNIPAPRHLTRRGSGGSLKKMRDHMAASGAEYVEIGSRSDGMAHVGYTELKLHSDSESEFLFSDDDAFLQITDFIVEPSEKRVHKSRSQNDFILETSKKRLHKSRSQNDFNLETSKKRVHKPRSRKSSFEDKKMSNHKQPDLQENQDKNIHLEDYKNVESSMLERNLVNKTQKQRPVKAEEHIAVLSELITMSKARPFPLGLPQEDNEGAAAQNAEVSENSSPSGGEFLSPSGENGASREIKIQADDDSSDFAESISGSAHEADMEQKVSDNINAAGSVSNEPSSDEENEVEADSKLLMSKNNKSDSLEQEQSSEKENEVNENNVAEEYFSNEEEEEEVSGHSDEPLTSRHVSEKQSSEEEDGSNGYSVAKDHSSNEEDEENEEAEPLTSKHVAGSSAEEQSSEEKDGSNGYSVAKDHSSNDEDVDESEPLTSKHLAGSSAEEQPSEEEDGSHGYSVAKDHSSNEEDVDNEESEALTSNDVTDSATEEHSAKEEHGNHEETEPLTSQKISTEESSNRSSELKISASVESFASISSEIEGENLVDLLKKQLEHDRKCLTDLTKELEEERNASAIATNQAMAMITRLQEEKAALHMEALQYLRMMDEQAEHDVDALERANDVLADREKEIQDLEMELEYYRVKYPDEPREEILASMGILGNIEEINDTPTPDETNNKASTDTKHIGSPSAGN